MRIEGGGRIRAPSGTAPRRATSAGFTLEGHAAEAPSTGAAASVGGAPEIGLLLALQSVEPDSRERRRRAVARGRSLLDLLDKVKLGLIEGRIPPAALQRLRSLLAEHTALGVEDQALAEVVAAVELRAAVELAKLDT